MVPTRSSNLNGLDADERYRRWHPRERLHRIISWGFWGVLATAVAAWYPIYNADEKAHHAESQANRDRITKLEIIVADLKEDNGRLQRQYEEADKATSRAIGELQKMLEQHMNDRRAK